MQIETARGLVEVERIAAAGHPLEALVFGPGDFAASLGVPVLTIGAGSWEYALARIAVAARAYGLQAVDGPYADLNDLDGLRAAAQSALALGFDGKWVVHPDQIGPVNEVFTPSRAGGRAGAADPCRRGRRRPARRHDGRRRVEADGRDGARPRGLLDGSTRQAARNSSRSSFRRSVCSSWGQCPASASRSYRQRPCATCVSEASMAPSPR